MLSGSLSLVYFLLISLEAPGFSSGLSPVSVFDLSISNSFPVSISSIFFVLFKVSFKSVSVILF